MISMHILHKQLIDPAVVDAIVQCTCVLMKSLSLTNVAIHRTRKE